ncbi:MAG: CARDB domain-containing protein [Chitinophagaceae bacterium]
MKIATLATTILVFSFASNAQVSVQRPTEVKKLQSAEVMRKTPVNTLPSPVASTPDPVSTANLTPGKDLSVQIRSLQYNPANGGSVQVNYVVKNNGTEALDINNVAVQGYLDYNPVRPTDPAPSWPVNGKNYFIAGGHVLSSIPATLNPGQEKEGVLNYFNISKDHYFNTTSDYTYMLWVDKDRKVSEANETNNFATYKFRGYQGQYQPAVSASQYYLTNAFVTIKTGADNKEKESEVNFRLIPAMTKDLSNTYNEFVAKIQKNQQTLLPNLPATFPLYLFMSSTAQLVNPVTSLASFNQNGLGLAIEYKANFLLDAWKIEQVELTLYFKDANGLYHPTQGVKTVKFNVPANTFLDGFGKKILVCKADNALNAVSVKTVEKFAEY